MKPTSRRRLAKPAPAVTSRAHVVALALAFVCACDGGREVPQRVETTFELFVPPVTGEGPWKCATALPPVSREAATLRAVLGPDPEDGPLDGPSTAAAMASVGARFTERGMAVLRSDRGVEAARAAVDLGVPVLVPFAVPDGARPVIVSGYRTVEGPDGGCTDALQDVLVVDTVEVMAYGMPLDEYAARLAGPDVLALGPDDGARAALLDLSFSTPRTEAAPSGR